MCKFLPVGVILLTLTIMAGCSTGRNFGDSDIRSYQKIHDKYSRMESYTAKIRLTVKGNKSEKVYEMSQQVKAPDRAVVTVHTPTELSGVQIVYQGEQVMVRRKENAPSLTLDGDGAGNYLFVNEFFSLYYQSEKTAICVSGGGQGQDMLLETSVFPKSTDRDKIVMRMDGKKLIPKTLTVYDIGGNIRLMAEFLEFSYNKPLEDKIFQIKET